MKRNILAAIIYFSLNLIFFMMIIFSVVLIDLDQKNNIADATVNLTRDNFLVGDFREVSKDIEKIKGRNFNKIEVLDKNKEMIIVASEGKDSFNLKINKYIWADEKALHQKGQIVFHVGVDNLIQISLKILMWSILFTAPVFILFEIYLRRRQSQLLENEKIKIMAKLTRQMSHDIRSPVATLYQLSKNIKSLTLEEEILLKSSLKRIDEIANVNLESSTSTYLEAPEISNLSKLISELINEKKIEYPFLNIILNMESLDIKCSPGDFKRIISNIINNSYESIVHASKNVEISTFEKGQEIIIQITDNGSGIPKNIINKIGTDQITSKKKGNGLGLMHARETLLAWDARFQIIRSDLRGTVIEIVFPIPSKSYILIDDDELVQLTWESKARKNNVDLKTFRSFEDFEKAKDSIKKDSLIYIDSELGQVIKGEDIARFLHKEGFVNISMSTGHSADLFKELHFLKSVINKKAPF